jgi:hypothetical protein
MVMASEPAPAAHDCRETMTRTSILSVISLLVALLLAASHARAQPTLVMPDSADVRYYDRWPGTWYRVTGDRVDSLPTFIVRRGPGNSFEESWHLTVDGTRSRSFGLRGWDPDLRSWRLVWVADPGHFQIWDGVKSAGGWYIIRRFGADSTAFLSRQAWIPQGPDMMLRTVERSTDGGKTWTTRYRDLFKRGKE